MGFLSKFHKWVGPNKLPLFSPYSIRDHPFKTSANFHDFQPLPPQGVPWICWSFFTGIFLLGGSHLWPYLVNMGTSIIWCDSNIKVQYFSVWLWYTLCSPLMAYHHNDRLHEKVSWLLPNHIPIKLLFLFSTQLN